MCGDFRLNDANRPDSGAGSTVIWSSPQTDTFVPIYWFAAHTFGAPGRFNLVPHPTQGGYFGDDSRIPIGEQGRAR